MADTAELKALLARVEEAEGRDRELDAQLWFLTAGAAHGPVREGHEDYGTISRSFWAKGSIGIWDDELPYYSSSIDAALALTERVLPGFLWSLDYDEDGVGGPRSYTAGLRKGYHDPETVYGHSEHSPALAIIAALLKAKIAEAESEQ